MANIAKQTIKNYFETGDRPTEDQFSQFIDTSYNNYIDATNFNGLQAAIDAASPGDTVCAYGQSYTVSSTINIDTDDVTLQLYNTTVTVADNADITLFKVTGNRSGIKGGIIDGNRANQPGTTNRRMVWLETADDSFCIGVRITDSDGYGIQSRDSRRSVIAWNTVIDSRYIGIYSLVANIASNIEGSSIRHNIVDRRALGASVTEGGIKIHQSGGTTGTFQTEDWVIESNRVYLDPGASGQECYVASGNKGRFVNNYGFGSGIGVSLVGTDITCTSNIFEDTNTWGIEIARLYNSTVSGNIVNGNGNTRRGITQNASDVIRSTHNTITGNTVRDCSEENYYLRYLDHSTFTGNISKGGVRSLISECVGLTFTGNTFDDDGDSLNAFLSLVDQDDISLIGNLFKGANTTRAIDFTSSDAGFIPDNITIIGNYFDVTGLLFNTTGLSSGSIGENWNVRDNSGPALDANTDYLDYADNISFKVKAEDPSTAGEAAGQASLLVDKANNKLYIKTGAGNTDWTLVGNQT